MSQRNSRWPRGNDEDELDPTTDGALAGVVLAALPGAAWETALRIAHSQLRSVLNSSIVQTLTPVRAAKLEGTVVDHQPLRTLPTDACRDPSYRLGKEAASV